MVIPAIIKGTADEPAYIAHETAHYNRQGLFPIAWVVKYFTNKKFRFQEELLAFRAEIEKKRELNLPVNIEDYATAMSEQYWDMCTVDEALLKLQEMMT